MKRVDLSGLLPIVVTKHDRRSGCGTSGASMTTISQAIERSSSSAAKIALFRSLFRGRDDADAFQ
jgi:hypothetical protein